ncbi:hypothetical protein KAW65_00270 [candidate division WOR-3 bacterium]|nr:hypothetical protein [candidate division WOR-3 bacterium]
MANIEQILKLLDQFEDIEIRLHYKPKHKVAKSPKEKAVTQIGAKILEILLKLLPHAPTMKDIANGLNQVLKCNPKISSEKVEHILRKELHLKPERTKKGYVIRSISVPELKALAQKYGFNIKVIDE